MAHQKSQNSNSHIAKKSDIVLLEKINNFLKQGSLYKVLKPLVLMSYDNDDKPITAENFSVGNLCVFIHLDTYYEDTQFVIQTNFLYNGTVCTLEINNNSWLEILESSLEPIKL